MSGERGMLSPQQRLRIRNVVILACAVDAADKALLPATFAALAAEMHLGPKDLGFLAFAQSIAFSLALPVWGAFMHQFASRDLMALGCFVWGVATLALACTTGFVPQLLLRLVVGAALAVVNPIGQAVICDVVPEADHGWAFGLLQSASTALAMATTYGVTSFAMRTVGVVQGWRVAYVVVACVSFLVSGAVRLYVPRSISSDRAPRSNWLAEQGRVVKAVASKPSFLIMVAQGVTGGIPWHAFSFLPFYLQLSGHSDMDAGQIMLLGSLGGVFGAFLGGFLSDRLASWWPDGGRCVVSQASVALGTVAFIWFMTMPYDASTSFWTTASYFLFSLVACWTPPSLRAMSGVLFSNSVERAQVIALWIALEGITASVCGAPLVGVLSEMFGFKLVQGQESGAFSKGDDQSVRAMQKALLGVSILPWVFCFLAWVPMYWAFPKDRRASEANDSGDEKLSQTAEKVPEHAPVYVIGASKRAKGYSGAVP